MQVSHYLLPTDVSSNCSGSYRRSCRTC